MVRQGRPGRNGVARSFRQLKRFHHFSNSDRVFGTHRMILAIPAGSIADYLTKLVAQLAALASPQGKLQALRGFKARSDGKYDTIFPDGRLTFDTATFDTSFHS